MASQRDTRPDPREAYRLLGVAVRPIVGWVLAALGAVALLLGYFGISGEALVAKQLPFLISGGLGGIALVLLGGVFLGTKDLQQYADRLDRMEELLDDLHEVLLEPDEGVRAPRGYGAFERTGPRPASAQPAASTEYVETPVGAEAAVRAPGNGQVSPDEVVILPAGSTYHQSGCRRVQGKAEVHAVTAGAAEAMGLKPCKLCSASDVRV